MLLSPTLHAGTPDRRTPWQYPRWPVEFGILGPLEVRCASDVVPIRRGLPRTILVALVLRRGHTVTSDFLVDLLWGDELPRNPANALQIQVSYLRKTLGAAEPDGSDGTGDAGPAATPCWCEPEQIDAHRFEMAARSFTPLQHVAVRGASCASALDDVERALALWRGDALEDVADMEFARGEIARLEELRWVATERRVDLLLRLGRHGDTIGELVRAGPADAAARAIPRAARARPVPVGPPGRRPARLRAGPAHAGRGARHRARRGPA